MADELKKPDYLIAIDNAVRRFNHTAAQCREIPSVGINNRAVYSPRTITLHGTTYGLLDHTPVIPYNFDPVAIYQSKRRYAKFPIKTEYRDYAGHEVDFGIAYANVPPPAADSQFVNGSVASDVDAHVRSMLDYATGESDKAPLWTPFLLTNSNGNPNEWASIHPYTVRDFGIQVGPVFQTETISWNAWGQTFSYYDEPVMYYRLSSDPYTMDDRSLPATIDGLFDASEIAPVSAYPGLIETTDFSAPPIETAVNRYSVVPSAPGSIIDFKVDFEATKSGTKTTMAATASVPSELTFTNLTNQTIEIVIYAHAYQLYFQYDSGRDVCVKHSRCRNRFSQSVSRSEALALQATRGISNTFYDFGTGIKAGTAEDFNLFRLSPHETKALIKVAPEDIFKSDSSTAANWANWSNGRIYEGDSYRLDTTNPLNSGTYGFWIDLNECFFRLVDTV